jgi:peptidoglycan/LPS O-acetylase OafA/YrhL
MPDTSVLPATMLGRRNGGLDVVRALAILLVLASHLTSYGFATTGVVGSLVDLLGALGVEMFFSLSGFLIGGILIRLADDVRPSTARRFLVRRWMRTLPLYYAVLLFSCWMFRRVDTPAFFFLQSVWPHESTLVPQAWSLVLEELFYLLFPLVLLATRRWFGAGVGLVWRVAWLLIAAAWLARGVSIVAGAGIDTHADPLPRLDCAAYGVLAACLHASLRRPPPGGLPAALGAAVGVTAVYALGGWFELPRLLTTLEWPALDLVFALVVWAMFYALPRATGLFGWLSRISYSIYLVHMLILAFIMPAMFARFGPVLGSVFVVLLTLVVASVTWALIEQPFLWVRQKAVLCRVEGAPPA